jgi:cytochrome P450
VTSRGLLIREYPLWLHLCIDSEFARVEAQLILSMLAQHFHLEQVGTACPVKVEVLATLRPKGDLWMRLPPLLAVWG